MEAPTKESLLKRAQLFLEDGNWADAAKYAEKILDIDPECAKAYLVKALAAYKTADPEKLADCAKLGANPDFLKALRFANPNEKALYEAWLKKSGENDAQREEEKKQAAKKAKSKLKPVLCVILALLLVGGAAFYFIRPKYNVGDTVTMGSWGGEAIEWQVMEVKADGTYVLMSVKGLDVKPYNTEREDVTWETCTLRSWLNGEFYEKAISTGEKGKILTSTVENPDNKEYGVKGGKTTQDKVYLLSLDEVGRYFNVEPYSDDNRQSDSLICMPTNTAKQNGAYTSSAGACWWWLRSPGYDRDFAAYVGGGGYVNYDGLVVSDADACVRPVVCVRL